MLSKLTCNRYIYFIGHLSYYVEVVNVCVNVRWYNNNITETYRMRLPTAYVYNFCSSLICRVAKNTCSFTHTSEINHTNCTISHEPQWLTSTPSQILQRHGRPNNHVQFPPHLRPRVVTVRRVSTWNRQDATIDSQQGVGPAA